MPSRPVTPTPSPVPNAAPLAAAASIPVQLPPASSPASGSDSAALGAAASIPVQLPAASAQPAAEGPWTKYQTAQPSQPAPVTRDPWERPTSADDKPWLDFQAAKPGASAQAAEGPWTKYQTAQPSQPAPVTRDPWERPENNNAPWLDYQAAKPEPTVGAFIDPYANNSLADDTRLVGGLADKAVRNVVNGATLGYGDKIAAGLDALTGRSPDYASALNAERGAVRAGDGSARRARDSRADCGHGFAGRRDRQGRSGPRRGGERFALWPWQARGLAARPSLGDRRSSRRDKRGRQ